MTTKQDPQTTQTPAPAKLPPEPVKPAEFFTVNRKDLVMALKAVKHAVNSRANLPCLGYVTLQTGRHSLTVTAFDLDISISHTIPCDYEAYTQEAGPSLTVCLPHKDLLSMVSGKDGAASVTIHDNGVVECAPFKGKLSPLSVADMAPLPELKPMLTPQRVAFDWTLLAGLKLVQDTVSTDETRYVLNGVCFDAAKGEFNLVATDGRRLHKVGMPAVPESAKPFILPSASVKALVANLPKGASGTFEQCAWGSGGLDGVRFTFGATVLVSKLVQGNYPNYRQVIPSATEGRTVNLPCAAMAAVLDRAVKFIKNTRSESVKLTFTTGGVTLKTCVPDKGEQVETVPCNGAAVNGLAICFNPSFLRDIMTAGDYETMTARFTDDLGCGLFTAGVFLAVVMPMRMS